MSRSRVTTLLAVLALLVTTAASAFAAAPPRGDDISLFGDTPSEVEAGTPVFVAHGWHVRSCGDPVDGGPVGAYDFQLDVDGIAQRGRPLMDRGDEGCISKRVLYEFRDGLEVGDHTFTGHWLLPCSTAVETGWIDGPCPNPNASVEVLTLSRDLSFTE